MREKRCSICGGPIEEEMHDRVVISTADLTIPVHAECFIGEKDLLSLLLSICEEGSVDTEREF